MKLSSTQRKAFFARKWPTLAGQGIPPVKVGYVHQLSSRLSFEVVRVHVKRGNWRLEYQVLDDREERFYLLPTARSLRIGKNGQVLEMAPEEEIGYTRNPKMQRCDNARSVPPNVQNVLDMRAKLTRAQQPTSEAERRSQERSFRERLHSALDNLTPGGQTALLARLERDLLDATEAEKVAA